VSINLRGFKNGRNSAKHLLQIAVQ